MLLRALSCLALSSLLGCHGNEPRVATRTSEQRSAGPESNILRADYAGSEACKGCHPGEYEAWARSPMHRMTRSIESAEVRAAFDGGTFHFKGDSARLEQSGGKRSRRS